MKARDESKLRSAGQGWAYSVVNESKRTLVELEKVRNEICPRLIVWHGSSSIPVLSQPALGEKTLWCFSGKILKRSIEAIVKTGRAESWCSSWQTTDHLICVLFKISALLFGSLSKWIAISIATYNSADFSSNLGEYKVLQLSGWKAWLDHSRT